MPWRLKGLTLALQRLSSRKLAEDSTELRSADGQSEQDGENALWPRWRRELREIVPLGWPNSLNMFAQFFPGFIMLMFLSDADELAAAGLAFMFGNVTGVSVIVGFSTGLSPLTAQADHTWIA